mmetsp:Transcript_40348/g.97434  ORF Transcript_40348/g.97434 Transcript_40348/m.97434 type:complete len:242 (-) Transcript_40348:28-753(-)
MRMAVPTNTNCSVVFDLEEAKKSKITGNTYYRKRKNKNKGFRKPSSSFPLKPPVKGSISECDKRGIRHWGDVICDNTRFDSEREVVEIYYGRYDRWVDYFQVKQSSIRNAGLGLFAARKFRKDEPMGKYYGKIFNDDELDPNLWKQGRDEDELAYSPEYTMHVPKHGVLVVHERKSRTSTIPLFFGFHYCNDATWFSVQGSGKKPKDTNMQNNIAMDPDLTVYATRTIKKGEELLLTYGKL